MKTEHGYEVVESAKLDTNLYVVRIVREGHLHNHVVWNMNSIGKCSNGEYFDSEDKAKACFRRRI
jgi:hypothetical protein